jgi:hypothetical protein
LALLHCRLAMERNSPSLEQFFSGQSSGFIVQLGLDIGVDGRGKGMMEDDGWRILLVEMDEEKVALARRSRHWLKVLCCAIAPDGPAAASQAWVVSDFDSLGFSPHTRSIPRDKLPPTEAVPSGVSTRPLGCVLREQSVPENFEVLTIGPCFDAGDAVTSTDWKYFRPRLVLIDSRAQGQERARRLLESAGWRRAHWGAMCFWFVRGHDLSRFRRERILLAIRLLLWALKRHFQ